MFWGNKFFPKPKDSEILTLNSAKNSQYQITYHIKKIKNVNQFKIDNRSLLSFSDMHFSKSGIFKTRNSQESPDHCGGRSTPRLRRATSGLSLSGHAQPQSLLRSSSFSPPQKDTSRKNGFTETPKPAFFNGPLVTDSH